MNIVAERSPATGRAARCGMDVLQAIYDRRAVRAFTPRKVPIETVRALIDAAIQAPSAVNEQPWAFAVIQNPDLLRRVSERAKTLSLQHLKPGTRLWEHRAMLTDPAFNVFYDAGTVIVVCATPGGGWPANEDCCLAAQNLMLAAHGLGLGTCPIGFAREALNELQAREELRIPGDFAAVMAIAVGYPREIPEPTPRREPRIVSWK